ncbi:urotensin-2 [Ursus maritimus]|uniref:Urotensin-2 n=1 Tax=Ursus maritimus TaxID=29073 RepID=A0A8M1H1Q8_URSMA|nr:urotensin-2 [Ursus maritimus]
MCKLIFWCLLFIGCLHPLLSLPVPDSREETLQLSVLLLCVAPGGDTRPALDELERVSPLQMLLEMSGAGRGDGLREAGKIILAWIRGLILMLLNYSLFSCLGTDAANPRGSLRRFQAFSGQDPNIFLSHLLARNRKQDKKRGSPSECFWKYCV